VSTLIVYFFDLLIISSDRAKRLFLSRLGAVSSSGNPGIFLSSLKEMTLLSISPATSYSFCLLNEDRSLLPLNDISSKSVSSSKRRPPTTGELLGFKVGATDGASEGDFVGASEGNLVGASEGDFVGASEGNLVGASEGDFVGA
jgi:hypothetical protein